MKVILVVLLCVSLAVAVLAVEDRRHRHHRRRHSSHRSTAAGGPESTTPAPTTPKSTPTPANPTPKPTPTPTPVMCPRAEDLWADLRCHTNEVVRRSPIPALDGILLKEIKGCSDTKQPYLMWIAFTNLISSMTDEAAQEPFITCASSMWQIQKWSAQNDAANRALREPLDKKVAANHVARKKALEEIAIRDKKVRAAYVASAKLMLTKFLVGLKPTAPGEEETKRSISDKLVPADASRFILRHWEKYSEKVDSSELDQLANHLKEKLEELVTPFAEALQAGTLKIDADELATYPTLQTFALSYKGCTRPEKKKKRHAKY